MPVFLLTCRQHTHTYESVAACQRGRHCGDVPFYRVLWATATSTQGCGGACPAEPDWARLSRIHRKVCALVVCAPQQGMCASCVCASLTSASVCVVENDWTCLSRIYGKLCALVFWFGYRKSGWLTLCDKSMGINKSLKRALMQCMKRAVKIYIHTYIHTYNIWQPHRKRGSDCVHFDDVEWRRQQGSCAEFRSFA